MSVFQQNRQQFVVLGLFALLIVSCGITPIKAQQQRYRIRQSSDNRSPNYSSSIASERPTRSRQEASRQPVSSDLLKLYENTKSVETESDVTEIAQACARVIPDATRSKVDRDYAASLLAWALNRRGEMRSEAAADLVARGMLDEAASLDRKAADDFQLSIKHGPDNWRTRHNYAIALAMRNDFEEAIEQFSVAIDLNDDYPNAYFNRGELYFETGRYNQAIRDYSRAIELNDQDPQYFNSRGHSKFMLEAFDEAIVDYRQAAERAGDSAVYHTDLADAYHYLGRWEQAATAYRRAIGVNSDYARAYQNAAWLMATCPEAKMRNVQLALSAAKRAAEIQGRDNPRVLDTLAAALAANGEYSRATEIQREAIELADAGERAEFRQRLRLYEQKRNYVQPIAANQAVREGVAAAQYASGQESDSGLVRETNASNSRSRTATAASTSRR